MQESSFIQFASSLYTIYKSIAFVPLSQNHKQESNRKRKENY